MPARPQRGRPCAARSCLTAAAVALPSRIVAVTGALSQPDRLPPAQSAASSPTGCEPCPVAEPGGCADVAGLRPVHVAEAPCPRRAACDSAMPQGLRPRPSWAGDSAVALARARNGRSRCLPEGRRARARSKGTDTASAGRADGAASRAFGRGRVAQWPRYACLSRASGPRCDSPASRPPPVLPTGAESARRQWKKWRVPVKYIVTPGGLARPRSPRRRAPSRRAARPPRTPASSSTSSRRRTGRRRRRPRPSPAPAPRPRAPPPAARSRPG